MSVDTLIVNLTRFGDLLQCQPLIHDLHSSGHTVGLVCLDNFAAALPLLRHLDAAWPLPGAGLMADLDKCWQKAAARLLDFARSIREQAAPRRVVNLTPTLPGRLLTRLLAPSPDAVLGFGMDAHGFGFSGGIWAAFLNGATLQRLNAPFNLADMFRMVGAPAPGSKTGAGTCALQRPAGESLAFADTLLARPLRLPASPGARIAGFVGLQLGASEARRQWPTSSFAALGDRLWQEQALCPVLLGAAAESPLARDYAARAQGPFVDAVGKTDIPQLAALLSRLRLLVTNDTGTMHLAAGLGLPCLAFFLATAQPWDTGPYLPGCCCLEPALPCHPCPYNSACPHEQRCLEQISPQNAGDLALGYLTQGNWQAGLTPEICRKVRVWVTETDAQCFARVRSLSGHEQEDRSLWLGQQRLFWRQILDSLETAQARPGEASEPLSARMPVASDALPYSAAFRETVAPVLSQAAQLLDLLAEQGRLTGRSARAGQLFLRNCERLQSLLDACPPLSSLGHFWRVLCMERGGRLDELLTLVTRLSGHVRRWAAAVAV
ncbi:glycosyltransferase family 9 protein [Desulfovibrio sp. ZJ200]|uniref:glycosyltransferase family 9 protein n=1 Tax=Desulfovibrio sp. ZJ200 TaxID=2709792 RepID=UPI0013EE25E2|nr:glycosyltransferase family 9 protein [Desulfovibrio sp. ZJ200]